MPAPQRAPLYRAQPSQWPVDPRSALQQGAPPSAQLLPNSQNYGEDNDYIYGDEANPTRRNGVQAIAERSNVRGAVDQFSPTLGRVFSLPLEGYDAFVERLHGREPFPSNQETPQETIGTYSPPPDMAGAFAGGEQLSPAVVQTIIAESLGEGPEGMRLVAETIMNRARERGITPEQVVMERGQYAGRNAKLDNPANRAAATAAWGAAQSPEDPTMGAEYFYSGDTLPSATEDLQVVYEHGNHRFLADQSTVKEMQTNLKAAGLYDGEIDGDFGPATRTAANAFREGMGAADPVQALTSLGVEPAAGQEAIANILQQPESLPAFQQVAAVQGNPTSEDIRAVAEAQMERWITEQQAKDAAARAPTPQAATGLTIPSAPAPMGDQGMAGRLQQGVDPQATADMGAFPPIPGQAPAQTDPRLDALRQRMETDPAALQEAMDTTPPPDMGGQPLPEVLQAQAPSQAGVDATGAPVSYAGDYNDILDAGALTAQPQQPAPTSYTPFTPRPADRSDLTQAGPRYDPLNPASAATPPPMAGDPYADFETMRGDVRSPQTLRDMMGQAGLDDSQWDAGALGIPSQAIPPSTHPALMQQQYEQAARRDWARPQAPAAPPPQYDERQEQIQEGQYRIGAPFNAEAEAAEAASVRERLAAANPARLLRDEREMASIARTQPIGPPESRNYRIGQGLRPDLQETVGIGGPDAPPPMATATQDFGPPPTPIADIGLTAMPPAAPEMSISDFNAMFEGAQTPERTQAVIDRVNARNAALKAAQTPAPVPAAATAPAAAVAPQASTGTHGGPGGNLSAADALDLARAIEGNSEIEPQGQALISQYLQTGGIGMDPAVTPWCAAMVNASLAQVGIEGTGSMAASSFAEWGDAVEPGDVQKGDVLYKMGTAQRVGDAGGHVGFATGNTRMEDGVLQYEMYGGNQTTDTSGERGVTANVKWVDASEFNPRRAPVEAQQVAAATTAAAAQALGDVSAQTEQTRLSHVDGGDKLLPMAEAAKAAGVTLEVVGGVVTAYQDAAKTVPATDEQRVAIATAGGPDVSIDYGQPGVINVAAAGPQATTSATTAAEGRVQTGAPVEAAVPITPAPTASAPNMAPTSYTPFTPDKVIELDLYRPDDKVAAARDPFTAAGQTGTDIGGAVTDVLSGIPPMNQPPSNPNVAAEEALTGAGEALRKGVNTAATGGYRYGAGYEPSAAGAAGTAAAPPPAATAAVAPPSPIVGQEVAAVPGSEGRVQLTAPVGTQYNTMEGPVVGTGPPGPQNLGVLDAGPPTGAPPAPIMTGKEKDDYLGPTERVVQTVPVPEAANQYAPPEYQPPVQEFRPPEGVPGAPIPGMLDDPFPDVPVMAPAPVEPQQQPPPDAAVAPPSQKPEQKPTFQEGADKYSGRSRTFSDPIEYAARIATSPDGKFNHDKFWEDLGNRDLTQTQQTVAAKTAAQGHFTQNKFSGFMPNIGMPDMGGMSNMLNAVQDGLPNLPNPVQGLSNFFGNIFSSGVNPRSGGIGSDYAASQGGNYNTFGQQGPPGSSGNYGGSYTGPGSGSYGGGGMGGSQYGGGFGAGGFGGSGTYGGAGGANIGQGVGGGYRNR